MKSKEKTETEGGGMLHPSPNLIKNGCFLGPAEEREVEDDKQDMEETGAEENRKKEENTG